MTEKKVVSLPEFTKRWCREDSEEALRSSVDMTGEAALNLASLIDDFVDDLSEAFSDKATKRTPEAR